MNAEPREQGYQQQQQAYEYQPYIEGYTDLTMRDAWPMEGEKLRPESKERRGLWGLLALLLVLCVLAVVGSMYGLIVSWLSWVLIIALVFVGAVAIISNWRVVTIPIPLQTFQVSERPMLVINNTMGTVSLRRGEQGGVSVTGVKRASGVGIKPNKMQVTYNQQGNILNISGHVFWNLFQFGLRRIDLEITVPATCDIELVNGSGRIIVQDANGTFRLRTGSGRIEASNLEGLIDLQTGSGRIEFNHLYGQINLRTGSSRIEGRDVRGQLAAQTGSGRIEIRQAALTGDSRLKTGSSSITFEGSLNPRGSYQMTTGSGGINVTLPDDAAFSLKASTGSGKVLNEFGSNEVGSLPRPQLKLRTGSGGIHIYRGTGYPHAMI